MFLQCRTVGAEGAHTAGRQLLSQMFAEHVGTPMPDISIAPGGKPYFADCPWFFSISHTRRRVFCVLCRQEVGLDAEELDREVKLSLAEKILSPGEKAEFDRAQDKRLALLTFWVMKEADAKRTGRGIRGYPNKTNFSLSDPRVFSRDGCVLAIFTQEDEHHAL